MTASTPFYAAASLAAVLGLIWLIQKLARAGFLPRPPDPGPGTRLRQQQVLALDPQRRLHLVRCDHRDVLLLTGGPGGDLVVGWLPPEDAP